MEKKGYGRLASYTHIDRLFGGHLLSSILCEECNTCIQRVEPFLDLSLPISIPAPSDQDDLPSRHSAERQPSVSKYMNKKQHKLASKNSKVSLNLILKNLILYILMILTKKNRKEQIEDQQ